MTTATKSKPSDATKVKKLREQAKLSQEQLAQKAGVARTQVSRIETDKPVPAEVICKVLCALEDQEPVKNPKQTDSKPPKSKKSDVVDETLLIFTTKERDYLEKAAHLSTEDGQKALNVGLLRLRQLKYNVSQKIKSLQNKDTKERVDVLEWYNSQQK